MQDLFFKHIRIDSIGHGGVGVGTLENGKKILIKGPVIPNSTVTCRVTRKRKEYIEARLITTETIDTIPVQEIEKNENIVVPKCPHYNHPFKEAPASESSRTGCGGCKRQVLSYDKQLELKMHISQEVRRNVDYLENCNFFDIVGGQDTYGYRNKIEFSFGKYLTKNAPEHDKHRQCGFHKQGHFSKVVDVDQCFLIDEDMHQVYKIIRDHCINSGLPVYDQVQHTGFFRHMVIRKGYRTGQILVNLSVASGQLKSNSDQKARDTLGSICKQDEDLRARVQCFCISHNNGLADAVKSPETTIGFRWGDGYIHEQLQIIKTDNNSQQSSDPQEIFHIEDGIPKSMGRIQSSNKNQTDTTGLLCRISAHSFFQTNTYAAELLYNTAIKFLGHIQGKIIDMYCGTGSIGLSLLYAGLGDSVLGIEIVDDAVQDARINAKINGLGEKSRFITGKAEDILRQPDIITDRGNVGLLVVDPPRDGLHKHVVSFLNTTKNVYNGQLLYISCNPITLKRDVGDLVLGGRKVKIIQPIDMFPQTHHIETICILT